MPGQTTHGHADAIALLREMIRQACVNDGTETSGGEIRNVMVLQRFLADHPNIETQVFESMPGRSSLIARVRGTEESAPKLGLLGHTDVVPVDASRWTRDPFGGELIDGEIWGRGAVDMLYLTAVFAVVLKEVAEAETPPRGDVVLLAVADEEAGSKHGLGWIFGHHPEVLDVTEVLSESGGMRMGAHVAIGVAEKGSAGRKLIVHGRPGHASIPYGAQSAAFELGEVLRRLYSYEPATQVTGLWEAFVDARVDDPRLRQRLHDPVRIDSALSDLGSIAGYAHAISRVTVSPTVVRAGSAHNVIPGKASINLDIRTLPGTSDDDVDSLIRSMLGDFEQSVEIERLLGWGATSSPTDTPLFQSVERAIAEVAEAPVVPITAAGGSDARMFRERGVPSYGFGLLGPEWTYEQYRSRIHGFDERIDVTSVRLTLAALRRIVHDRVV